MTAEFNPSSSANNSAAHSSISALTLLTQSLLRRNQKQPQDTLQTDSIIKEPNLPPREISEEMNKLLNLKSTEASHESLHPPAEVPANSESDKPRHGRSRRELRAMQDRNGRHHYVTAQVEAQHGGQFVEWATGLYHYYHNGVLQGQTSYIVGLDGSIYQIFEPQHAGPAPASAYSQGQTGIRTTQAPPQITTSRNPKLPYWGPNQSDLPGVSTRKPGQAGNNNFDGNAATRAGVFQKSSLAARHFSTKRPAPLYHSKYDENGRPVDASQEYTGVTDYYGRTVKTHVVGYDMNGKEIFAHLGRRKLIGMLPNKTAVYGDYERVLIGWDENRRPMYMGDNRPQGTIDPQYLGRTASTPAYGKGFEFADTNWWEHNYTTTTRGPRINIPTSRPSYLNQYDKYGHVTRDPETEKTRGRGRSRAGQHQPAGPGNPAPIQGQQPGHRPPDNRAPHYGENSDPGHKYRNPAGGHLPQRHGSSNQLARWQVARPKYPQYFVFEDIIYKGVDQMFASVRSKRQIGVRFTELAAPPIPTGNQSIDIQAWTDYAAQNNIYQMQQRQFSSTIESEKPLMDTIKTLEREMFEAEQARMENAQQKRESVDETAVAKLPVAYFTSETMDALLEEVLPRYRDAYGNALTEVQAEESFHNKIAEDIKTRIFQYFRNPESELEKKIIRFIKACAGFKTIFGKNASFVFTPTLQKGLVGEYPRNISLELRYALADKLLNIQYNPIYIAAGPPDHPYIHLSNAFVQKIETELYDTQTIVNIYYDPAHADALTRASEGLEKTAKTRIADEMIARRTPGFPLVRTSKAFFTPESGKYSPVSINTLEEYEQVVIAYDLEPGVSIRDERAPLEVLARMPFQQAGQELRKIFLPLKSRLDRVFVRFAGKDSAGNATGKIVRWKPERSVGEEVANYYIDPLYGFNKIVTAIMGKDRGDLHMLMQFAEREFNSISGIHALCEALEDCETRMLETIYHSKIAWHVVGVAAESEEEFRRMPAYRIWVLCKYAISALDDGKGGVTLAMARFLTDIAEGNERGDLVRIALKEINRFCLAQDPEQWRIAEQADEKLVELRNSVREIKLQDHIETRPQIAELLSRIGQLNFESLVETDDIVKARQISQEVGSALIDLIITVVSRGSLFQSSAQNAVEIIDNHTLGVMNYVIAGCVEHFDKVLGAIPGADKYITTDAIEKVMAEIEANFDANDNLLGKTARIFRGHFVQNIKQMFCIPGSFSPAGLISLLPQTIFSTLNDLVYLDMITHNIKGYRNISREHVNALQRKYFNSLADKGREELKANFKWVYYSLCKIGAIEDSEFLTKSQPLFFGENFFSLLQEYVASTTGEAPLPEHHPLEAITAMAESGAGAEPPAADADPNAVDDKKRTLVDPADIVPIQSSNVMLQGQEAYEKKHFLVAQIYIRQIAEIKHLRPTGMEFPDADYINMLGPLDPEVAQLKATFNMRGGTGGYPAYDEYIRKFTITTTNAAGQPREVSFEVTLKSNNVESAQEVIAEQMQKNQEFMDFLADKNRKAAEFCVIADVRKSGGGRTQTVARQTVNHGIRFFDVQVDYQAVHKVKQDGYRAVIGVLPRYSPVNPTNPEALDYCRLMNDGQVLQEDRFKVITEVPDRVVYIKGRMKGRQRELFYDEKNNLITTREGGTQQFSSVDSDFTREARIDHARKRGFFTVDTETHVVPVATEFGKFKVFSKTPFIFRALAPIVSPLMTHTDVETLKRAIWAGQWVADRARTAPFMGLGVVHVDMTKTASMGLGWPYVEAGVVGSAVGQTTLYVDFETISLMRTSMDEAAAASAASRALRNRVAANPFSERPTAIMQFFWDHLHAQFNILATSLTDAVRFATPDIRFNEIIKAVFAPLTPYADVGQLKSLLLPSTQQQLRAAAQAASAQPNNAAAQAAAVSATRTVLRQNLYAAALNSPVAVMDAIARFDEMVSGISAAFAHDTLDLAVKHEADHASNNHAFTMSASDKESFYQEKIFYSFVKSLQIAAYGIEMSTAVGLNQQDAVATFYGHFDSAQHTAQRWGYDEFNEVTAEQTSMVGEVWDKLKVLSRANPQDYERRIDQITRSLIKNPTPQTLKELGGIFAVANRHLTTGDRHQLADTAYDFLSQKTQRALQNLQDFTHAVYTQIKMYGQDQNRYIQLLRSNNIIKQDYDVEWRSVTTFIKEFDSSLTAIRNLDLTRCFRDIRMVFDPEDLQVKKQLTRIGGRAFATIYSRETQQPLYTVAHQLAISMDRQSGKKTLLFVSPLPIAPADLLQMVESTQRAMANPGFPALIGSTKDFMKNADILVNHEPKVSGKILDAKAFKRLFETSATEVELRRSLSHHDISSALTPRTSARMFWDFTLVEPARSAGGTATAVKYQYSSYKGRTYKIHAKRQLVNSASAQNTALPTSRPVELPITPVLVKVEYLKPNSTEIGRFTVVGADANGEPAFYGKNLSTDKTKIRVLQLLSTVSRGKVDDIVSMKKLNAGESDYQDFMNKWNARNAQFKLKLSKITRLGMFATFIERLMEDCDVYFSLGDVSWRQFMSRTDHNIDKVIAIMRALEFRKGAVERPDGLPYIPLTDIYNVIDVNFHRFQTRASALDMLYELSMLELGNNKCATIAAPTEEDLLNKIANYCRSVQCEDVDDETYQQSADAGKTYNKNAVRMLRRSYGHFIGHAARFSSKLNPAFHTAVVKQTMQKMEAQEARAVSQNDEILENLLEVLFPIYNSDADERKAYLYAGIKLYLENQRLPLLARFLNEKVFYALDLMSLAADEWKVTISWSDEKIRFEHGPQGSVARTISFIGLMTTFSPTDRRQFMRAFEECHALRGQKLFPEDKGDSEVTYTLIPAVSGQFNERFKISSTLKTTLDSLALKDSGLGYVLPELDGSESTARNDLDYKDLRRKFNLDKLSTYGINRHLQTRKFNAKDTQAMAKTFSLWLPSSEIARHFYHTGSEQAPSQAAPFTYLPADMQRDIGRMQAAVRSLPQALQGAEHAARAGMRYLMETYFTANTDAQRFSIIKHLVQERQKNPLRYMLERTVAARFNVAEAVAARVGSARFPFDTSAAGLADGWSYIFLYLRALGHLPEERAFLWNTLQEAFRLHHMELKTEIDYQQGSVSVTYDNKAYPDFADFKIADLEEFVDGLPPGTNFGIEYALQPVDPDELPRSVFIVHGSRGPGDPHRKANDILLYLNHILPGPHIEILAHALIRQLDQKKGRQAPARAAT
ncbi:hypothetical protein GT347_05075 [Xylophilus rhododendri]|uniref:Uncharacterized protein n=1 Tax=Xylophilus rhododendri TaxID=2697032 RepID=A0A857J2X9_9BURK|nr:hypothetical protein [Xylophilus rhododendri]QHI97411.1 hypothetical protein GT347_05075 [Xylophilus rhododendri]